MSRRQNALTAVWHSTTLPPGCHSPTPANPLRLDVQGLLLMVPVLLFSVIAHEYAHGYVALKQGDNTALMLGRLTWNPVKHIDPFMTVLLPLMMWYGSGLVNPMHRVLIGGAKPV